MGSSTRVITLTNELECKLKNVPNVSSLIRSLLIEYFNKQDDYKKIKEEELLLMQSNSEKEEKLLNVFIQDSKDIFGVNITREDAIEYRKGKFPTLSDFLIFKGYIKQG